MAMVAARSMTKINAKASTLGASFSQQCILQKGTKMFRKCGHEAAKKELDQMQKRNCFTPLDAFKLTPAEKFKAVEALMPLSEKRDKSAEGRMVQNGKPT